VVSPDIHNWVGTKSISGEKLANDLREHVENYTSEIFNIIDDEVTNIVKVNTPPSQHLPASAPSSKTVLVNQTLFKVSVKSGGQYLSKTLLITTGSVRRKLEIPGADRLEHKGLTYCASCDGLFFAGMDVVVVGAGNAAFESAQQLLAYCKSVTILVRSENIRADELTVESVRKNSDCKILLNTECLEVLGEKVVTGLKITNTQSGAEETLNIQGIFVEIGQIPNTAFAKNVVSIDKIGKIEIDPWTGKTSCPGVWAAGDCTNIRYHQNNIAAGDGVKALEDLYQYIKTLE
jgi:alkyl hydroperoxide reductase subunit F